MHIGHRIKEVMDQRHASVVSVARSLGCERTNVYNIFSRKEISTGLLQKICIILEHDFFKELSEDIFNEGKAKK